MTGTAEHEYTVTQAQRLHELGAPPEQLAQRFASADERDTAFKRIERDLTRAGRRRLQELRADRRTADLADLELALRGALIDAGFVQVVTPTIIAAEALDKMGVDHAHPLRRQVWWLEDGRCLRPMLAPNLYTLLRRLARVWSRPFGIFEIGRCFRRDTGGGRHLGEFTMLNVVELGTAVVERRLRLEELVRLVMRAAATECYELTRTESEVYGEMLDVEVQGLEVCSAAAGPHPLDGNWGITDPWVGLGFGLERLLMARDGHANIERVGPSLSYLHGVRLNL